MEDLRTMADDHITNGPRTSNHDTPCPPPDTHEMQSDGNYPDTTDESRNEEPNGKPHHNTISSPVSVSTAAEVSNENSRSQYLEHPVGNHDRLLHGKSYRETSVSPISTDGRMHSRDLSRDRTVSPIDTADNLPDGTSRRDTLLSTGNSDVEPPKPGLEAPPPSSRRVSSVYDDALSEPPGSLVSVNKDELIQAADNRMSTVPASTSRTVGGPSYDISPVLEEAFNNWDGGGKEGLR